MPQQKERREGKKEGRKGGRAGGREEGREEGGRRADLSMTMLVVAYSTVFFQVISNVFIQHLHSCPYCHDSSSG